MTSYEDHINAKVREFIQLEKYFLKFTYESKKPKNEHDLDLFFNGAIKIASKAFDLRNEIMEDFHDVTDLQIYDQKIKEILNKLKRNDKFHSIAFYQYIAQLINKTTENYSEKWLVDIRDYLSAKHDDLWEDFFSWFNLNSYYYAKIKIGPIVTSSHLPRSVQNYYNEIKEAYAFGLYKSSIALSRALLEMSLFDKLNKRGLFKSSNQKVINFDIAKEDNLYRYILCAKKEGLLDSKSKELADQVRGSANSILHLKENEQNLSEKETMEIIFKTVEVIEALYK